MSNAIQIDDLRKNYGAHDVLHGLTFDVVKGEIFALLGVNGAGKTTALECIEGLRKPSGGRITANGKFGIQLQSSSLPSHIKPMEAVSLFAKWNHAKIDGDMLAALGIEAFAKTQYIELSTGQKRRLHLALALTGDPDIIFLDEPTAGLDVEGRISLHAQIRKLKARGKTVILASHDMAEVESLCDRIAILREGRIVFLGSVAGLTEKIGDNYTLCFTTAMGEKSVKTGNLAETMLAMLEDFKRQSIEVRDIKIDRGTLEQHFIEMARGPCE